MSKPYASFGLQKVDRTCTKRLSAPRPRVWFRFDSCVYTFFSQFLVLFLHGYNWRSLFFVIASSIFAFLMSGTLDCPLFDAWPMAFSALNDSYNGPLVFTFCINPLFRLEVHIHCNTKLLLSFSKIQCKTLYSQGGLPKTPYSLPPFS